MFMHWSLVARFRLIRDMGKTTKILLRVMVDSKCSVQTEESTAHQAAVTYALAITDYQHSSNKQLKGGGCHIKACLNRWVGCFFILCESM